MKKKTKKNKLTKTYKLSVIDTKTGDQMSTDVSSLLDLVFIGIGIATDKSNSVRLRKSLKGLLFSVKENL